MSRRFPISVTVFLSVAFLALTAVFWQSYVRFGEACKDFGLSAAYQGLPRYKRKALILKEMRPYFKDTDAARLYVETNTWRKVRNLIARRTRMVRKINLQEFNYFVTVTYFYGHYFFRYDRSHGKFT